jgi:hypothetical protein
VTKADSLAAGGSDDAKNEKMLSFRGRDIEQFPESKSPPYRGAICHAFNVARIAGCPRS